MIKEIRDLIPQEVLGLDTSRFLAPQIVTTVRIHCLGCKESVKLNNISLVTLEAKSAIAQENTTIHNTIILQEKQEVTNKENAPAIREPRISGPQKVTAARSVDYNSTGTAIRLNGSHRIFLFSVLLTISILHHNHILINYSLILYYTIIPSIIKQVHIYYHFTYN